MMMVININVPKCPGVPTCGKTRGKGTCGLSAAGLRTMPAGGVANLRSLHVSETVGRWSPATPRPRTTNHPRNRKPQATANGVNLAKAVFDSQWCHPSPVELNRKFVFLLLNAIILSKESVYFVCSVGLPNAKQACNSKQAKPARAKNQR